MEVEKHSTFAIFGGFGRFSGCCNFFIRKFFFVKLSEIDDNLLNRNAESFANVLKEGFLTKEGDQGYRAATS